MFSIAPVFSNHGNTNVSTFDLAQGVFRRKLKLDFIVGLFLKQFTFIFSAKKSKPNLATKFSKIILSVCPCKGSFDRGFSIVQNYLICSKIIKIKIFTSSLFHFYFT